MSSTECESLNTLVSQVVHVMKVVEDHGNPVLTTDRLEKICHCREEVGSRREGGRRRLVGTCRSLLPLDAIQNRQRGRMSTGGAR